MTRRRLVGAATVIWTLTLLLLLIGAGVAPAHAAPVNPSSEGLVSIDPPTGPVGMKVTVFISLSLTPSVPYVLRVYPGNSSANCETTPPVPGLVITVGDQGGHADFILPSDLEPGDYAYCATPQQGTTQTAHYQSFLTLVAAGATSTPTTAPTSGKLTLQFPQSAAGAVEIGGTFGITVQDWYSSTGVDPKRVYLTLSDPSQPVGRGQPVPTPFPVSFTMTKTNPGAYQLQVTVPGTIGPGTYWVVVGDTYTSISAGPFQVVAAATPTAVAGPTTPVSTGTQGGASPILAIELVVGGILAAVVIALVVQVMRQRARV